MVLEEVQDVRVDRHNHAQIDHVQNVDQDMDVDVNDLVDVVGNIVEDEEEAHKVQAEPEEPW